MLINEALAAAVACHLVHVRLFGTLPIIIGTMFHLHIQIVKTYLHFQEFTVDKVFLSFPNLKGCSHANEDAIEGFKTVKTYPMEITPKHDSTERVLVVNSYLFARYLGRLDVNFIDGKLTQWIGNPIRLDTHVKQGIAILRLKLNYS